VPWRFRAETDRKLPRGTPCREIVRAPTAAAEVDPAAAVAAMANVEKYERRPTGCDKRRNLN